MPPKGGEGQDDSRTNKYEKMRKRGRGWGAGHGSLNTVTFMDHVITLQGDRPKNIVSL